MIKLMEWHVSFIWHQNLLMALKHLSVISIPEPHPWGIFLLLVLLVSSAECVFKDSWCRVIKHAPLTVNQISPYLIFFFLHFAFCAVKSSFLFTLLFSILLKTQALAKSRRKCAPFVAPCLSTVYQILPRYLVTKATTHLVKYRSVLSVNFI